MAEMPAEAVAQTGTCSKGESVKSTCHKPKKEECHSTPFKKSCQSQSATTCICTCLFQYTAPTPIVIPFQFDAHVIRGNKTGFLSLQYQSPYLAAPWQPPDMI